MRLEAHNLGFRYGKGSWVFRQINFTLSPGEIVGLAGPSGCGKTTLGRILAGYEIPDEGSVEIGQAIQSQSGYNPVQLVFQHPEKAVNSRWKMERILREGWNPDDEVISALGIEKEWYGRYPHELSGGELQRFCIARALSPSTRFLIADEMTAMLDAITQAQIWHAVLDIARKRNLGMLVISHEWHLLQRLCTRVVRWDFGKLRSQVPERISEQMSITRRKSV